MKSGGLFYISLMMTFFQVSSAMSGGKLASILKEKLGFSYVPMIPDSGTLN